MATMHLTDVSINGRGESLGVHVELQDAEDLGQKLLLMQIVKLEGGVHSINNGVLMNKPGKLLHDGGDQRSGVAEVVHDVAARNDVMSSIQAVVESSNTLDVVYLVHGDSAGDNSMLDFVLHSGLGGDLLGD